MTPQELYFISNELQRNGIKMASMELDAEKPQPMKKACMFTAKLPLPLAIA